MCHAGRSPQLGLEPNPGAVIPILPLGVGGEPKAQFPNPKSQNEHGHRPKSGESLIPRSNNSGWNFTATEFPNSSLMQTAIPAGPRPSPRIPVTNQFPTHANPGLPTSYQSCQSRIPKVNMENPEDVRLPAALSVAQQPSPRRRRLIPGNPWSSGNSRNP